MDGKKSTISSNRGFEDQSITQYVYAGFTGTFSTPYLIIDETVRTSLAKSMNITSEDLNQRMYWHEYYSDIKRALRFVILSDRGEPVRRML